MGNDSAMDCIDTIQKEAIIQMKCEGVEIQIDDLTPQIMGSYAAKALGVTNIDGFQDDFLRLLILAKLVTVS